jgi:hypothetical protein
MNLPLLQVITGCGMVEIREIEQDESFMLISAPHSGYETIPVFGKKMLQLEKTGQKNYCQHYNGEGVSMFIHTPVPADWAAFYTAFKKEIISLLFRFSLEVNKEDFFWIAESENTFFHFELVWDEEAEMGKGFLMSFSDQSILIDRSSYTGSDPAIRLYHARRLFEMLIAEDDFGLCVDFPLLSWRPYISDENTSRTLVIKLPVNFERYRLLPFEAFRSARLGQFGWYKKIQYLITDKPLMKDYLERLQILVEIDDPEIFIRKSVVIVNLYEHFKEDKDFELCKKGVELLKSILFHFNEVDFNGRPAALRWFFCASADEVLRELANNDTWFLFASFHTENNSWQLSNCQESPGFYENVCKLKLDHIRQMSVYHCNSAINEQGKAGIVSDLLARGAWLVEGSNKKESFFLFSHTLISLIINSTLGFFIQDDYLIKEAKDYLNQLENQKLV